MKMNGGDVDPSYAPQPEPEQQRSGLQDNGL